MPRKSKPWYWASRERWATTIGGKRVIAPAKVVTEHEAWAWHAEVTSESAPRPYAKSTTTVRDVFEAYAAWDAAQVEAGERRPVTTKCTLSVFQAAARTRVGVTPFGLLVVVKLTPTHYEGLLAAWRKAGHAPSTIAMMTQRVKTALRWAASPQVDRKPIIERSPFDGLKVPSVPATREKYGDRGLAARWLRYLWRAGHRDDALFQRCLIHTGARPSELAWGTWGDVKWDAMRDQAGNAMAVVTRSEWKNSRKTGRVRRVFLPARLVRAMRRREGSASVLIFPRPDGGRHTSPSLAGRMRYLREKAARAGVVLVERNGGVMTNYLWRHSAASTLLMNQVDVSTVAELLGTSVDQIRRTYGHLLEDHLAAASEKLGRRK